MKNATQDIIFPQELVDDLMKSFSEDEAQFTRLSSPLSNVNFVHDEENEN
jgi:hypothetical protein